MKLAPTPMGIAITNVNGEPAIMVLAVGPPPQGAIPVFTFILTADEAKKHGEALLVAATGLVAPSKLL